MPSPRWIPHSVLSSCHHRPARLPSPPAPPVCRVGSRWRGTLERPADAGAVGATAVVPNVIQRPTGQRVELELAGDRVALDRRQLGPQAALEAFATRDPAGERGQGEVERLRLADVAAHVGLAPPEIARAVETGDFAGVGADRADILEPQPLHQHVLVGERLREQLAGFQEHDRRAAIDARHHVQQHRTLGPERRDHGEPPRERTGQRGTQEGKPFQIAPGISRPVERRALPIHLSNLDQRHRPRPWHFSAGPTYSHAWAM